MSMLHTESVDRLLSLTSPAADPVVEAMEKRAETEGFPTVGNEVGSTLRLFARLESATSVFEFGSGFGYSAYWLAPVVGSDGTIVLTEVDEDELELAREYFERGGYDDRAVFELGDALDVVERYDGPFDMVLLDHENDRYVDAFEAVREKVRPGGLIVADNVLHTAEMDPAELERRLTDDAVAEPGSSADELGTYFEHVRDDPDFETTVLPVGEGLFASVRVTNR
ncbi:O-methyltransferase [Haloarcula nitratireducens]|uniref:O-methyltransferase n=1 Tax=Haloarcula nitratireducens TaxID=2487749 RepID=A0AAW4PBE2_9EURY|nr:O-methyltransferase [Halomicroarcula nitratireducens]MBX0294597.1 O-methyltransferase [Halomicroarcula nitratireducens]